MFSIFDKFSSDFVKWNSTLDLSSPVISLFFTKVVSLPLKISLGGSEIAVWLT